ncbi:flavin reductase domain protein FMN-binding [Nakamurella multipartita DSM 44233]|jgi:flavin reductase (DIM6/NTAB) family NADH-FMN oxidoreductase RutF|uniref:Flavin reductase domain protein FMN-binding n=2 Tax=Nakamurella TaxID=53460 RepID=C8XB98_NAKMY|nr:flavin reductase domain protein FMN-binding [Nakamurella multipartita DSM 44233]
MTAGCDPSEFRSVMGRFVTGVTVVTVVDGAGPHGVTVNSFTSLSLDPPLIGVCVRRAGRSAAALRRSTHFGVSILGAGQEELGRFFARADRPSGVGAFDRVPHRIGVAEVPLIDGAAAQLECLVRQRIRAGDHLMYVGEVIGLRLDGAVDSLAFHRGRFLSVA